MNEARFWAQVQVSDGCWVWQGRKYRDGYGEFKLENGRSRAAHRVALELTQGAAIPKHLYVCHRCDNPSCVRPEHLFIGTPSDNEQDKISKGRKEDNRGGRNGNAKLTPEDISEIKLLRDVGATYTRIALRFQVDRKTITNICKGKSWV